MKREKQANPIGAKLIRLVKDLAIPAYFEPILKTCKYSLTGHTKKAIETGDLLKISYMPGHIELTAAQQELEEAKNINLKVYHGKACNHNRRTIQNKDNNRKTIEQHHIGKPTSPQSQVQA